MIIQLVTEKGGAWLGRTLPKAHIKPVTLIGKKFCVIGAFYPSAARITAFLIHS